MAMELCIGLGKDKDKDNSLSCSCASQCFWYETVNYNDTSCVNRSSLICPKQLADIFGTKEKSEVKKL